MFLRDSIFNIGNKLDKFANLDLSFSLDIDLQELSSYCYID